MTLGPSPTSEDAFRSGASFCRERVPERSIYGLLYRESHRLFPDELFADLFADIGRRSVPPRIVAVVMVLQRLEGLSDREAADRITFDLRWKYAAGGLDFDYAGFVHTVLVDMRARLRQSERPNRIFEIALEVARDAGLIGRKRVLDSTPLYDAVATQDTVTMIRGAIRALLRIVDEKLGAELRACCKRDDDYVVAGKPSCDWDDAQAREALVDALARDAYAILAVLDGRTLEPESKQAAQLVATVVGQDLEQREDGMFRIARRVAKDRVISTVDPEARHGHKTSARGFDGYKGHIAIDPDSELITATAVTAGNASDGSVGEALVADVLTQTPTASDECAAEAPVADVAAVAPAVASDERVAEVLSDERVAEAPVADMAAVAPVASSDERVAETPVADPSEAAASLGPDGRAEAAGAAPAFGMDSDPCAMTTGALAAAAVPAATVAPVEIYGDSSYGTAKFIEAIEGAGAEANVKVQPPTAPDGKFAKDAFEIDLAHQTVRCPAGALVVIRSTPERNGTRVASFGASCNGCALRDQCTDGDRGRTIRIHPSEATLQRSRTRQRDPAWKARYRATRPKVERKLAHLTHRRHGGRRARMRGRVRVGHDLSLLAAAHNLRRLATLGVYHAGGTWRRDGRGVAVA